MNDTEELKMLREFLHSRTMHPLFEYTMTQGPGENWMDSDIPPKGEGWERNTYIVKYGWMRFEWHQESYWMREAKIEKLIAYEKE